MKNMLQTKCLPLWISVVLLPIQALGQQLWDGEGLDGEWTNAVNWTCSAGGACDNRVPDLGDSACNFTGTAADQTNIYVSADTTVTRIQMRNNSAGSRTIRIGTNSMSDITLGLSSTWPGLLANQKNAADYALAVVGEPNDFGYRLKLRIDFTGTTRPMSVTHADSLLVVSADIGGNGGFLKEGAGKMIIGGTNTYFGETTVTAGTIVLDNPKGLGFGGGPTTVSAGALDLNGQSSVNEILTLNGTGISSGGALLNSSGTPASLAGGISSISVTAGGTGYSSPPTVTFSGGGGSGAAAEALLGLTSESITIDNGGTGYDVAPYVIINGGGGTGAAATSAIDENGVVTNITVTASGLGYTSAPTITLLQAGVVNGGGTASGNAANFTVGGVRLTDAGTGYTSAPTVGFTGGSGSGATASANSASVTLASDSSVGGAGDITIEPAIAGGFGLSKVGGNTLNLSGANTYSGNTTVGGGVLALGAGGSIAGSPVIDVQLGATLDVSGVTGGFTLGAAQTLQGNGTVSGNVTADGTIAPGSSIGTLAFTGNLTLNGGLVVEVDKSVSPSNDVITVTGTLTNAGAGTVTVTNLGPALVAGDSFHLFDKAVLNGEALNVVSSGGEVWTNKLAVDGSVEVLSAGAPMVPATNLTIQAAGPTSYNLGGLGAASSLYDVYASTNIALPMSNWWVIGSTNSDAGGVIQFLDPQATNAQRFYRFGQTVP